MSELKNIHQLVELLPQQELDKLEAGALLHRRHASIIFKVIGANAENKLLTVQVNQRKNYLDRYLGAKDLEQRAMEFFGHFFNGWKIESRTVPYGESS